VDLAGSEKVSNHQNQVDFSNYQRSSFQGDGTDSLFNVKERVKEG
jgi:hypothetical protein